MQFDSKSAEVRECNRNSIQQTISPVGHSLTGLALLGIAIPDDWIRKKRKLVATGLAFIVLANAPDAPLPNWGHDRYDISHSVFSTTAGVLGLLLLYRIACFYLRPGSLPTSIVVCGILAWYSHLLLDSFYSSGNGIAVMWPFGDWRLNFPIPCFELLFPQYEDLRDPMNWLTPYALKVMAIEALAYGSLLVVVVGIRWRCRRKFAANTE